MLFMLNRAVQNRKGFGVLCALFVFLLGTMPAEAHFFSIIPDTTLHAVPVDREHQEFLRCSFHRRREPLWLLGHSTVPK